MPIEPTVVEAAKSGVLQDLVEGLRTLSPVPDPDTAFSINLTNCDLAEGDVVATSEFVVVVPWSYQCVHTGPFLEIPATFVQFELRGTTIVEIGGRQPDAWLYHRYIDYLGALHHIGVTTTNRPALTGPEVLEWRAQTTP